MGVCVREQLAGNEAPVGICTESKQRLGLKSP